MPLYYTMYYLVYLEKRRRREKNSEQVTRHQYHYIFICIYKHIRIYPFENEEKKTTKTFDEAMSKRQQVTNSIFI